MVGTSWSCQQSVLSKSPRLPLKAYDDLSTFKLYALDIGLLRQLSEWMQVFCYCPLPDIRNIKGHWQRIMYCKVLQHNFRLRSVTGLPGNKAEVDFLLQHGNHIYPVEVKADQNITGKSLIQYEKLYQPACRIRYSMLKFETRRQSD